MSGDVVQVIERRLEEQEKRLNRLTGFDRLDLNDAKARKQELEELLEEVKKQE